MPQKRRIHGSSHHEGAFRFRPLRHAVRYAGEDRFDITVKSMANPAFAPTWDMVRGVKSGAMSEDEYTRRYKVLLDESRKRNTAAWQALLSRKRVVLVCFCRAGSFCHRYLLADYLETLGAVRKGELPTKPAAKEPGDAQGSLWG